MSRIEFEVNSPIAGGIGPVGPRQRPASACHVEDLRMCEKTNCRETIKLATDVIRYAQRKLKSEPPGRKAVDVVSGFLILRSIEMTRAGAALLKAKPPAPVAIAILARAQLESAANLAEILDPSKTASEREEQARFFLKFAEYKHVEFFRDDLQGHRASLSTDEVSNWDRRVELHDEVERILQDPSLKQNRPTWNRNYPTWSGKTITATIRQWLGDEGARHYNVMSQIAHGEGTMIHKSIAKYENDFELRTPDSAHVDASSWLKHAARMLFVNLTLFLVRHGEIELDQAAKSLAARLGLSSLGAASGSTAA